MIGGGGGDPQQSSPPVNGGEIILQMLRRQPQRPITAHSLPHDPAVAVVGPTLPLPSFPSVAHDLRYPSPSPTPWPHSPPCFAPQDFFIHGGFPLNQNPNPNWSSPSLPRLEQQLPPGFNNLHRNQILLSEDVLRLGFLAANQGPNSANQQESNLIFGSLPPEVCNFVPKINGISCNNLPPGGVKAESSLAKEMQMKSMNDQTLNSPVHKYAPRVDMDAFQSNQKTSGAGNAGGLGRRQNAVNYRSTAAPQEARQRPPGFPNRLKSGDNRQFGNKRNFGNNVDKRSQYSSQSSQKVVILSDKHDRERRFLPGNAKLGVDKPNEQGLTSQLDYPGLQAASNLHSVSASDVEESLQELQGVVDEEEDEEEFQNKMRRRGDQVESELDYLEERLLGSLVLEDGSEDKNDKRKRRSPQDKDYRSDVRGKWLLSQKARNFKRFIGCRPDIDRLNVPLLEIYKSLIPADEEKEKQKQVLMLLEKLVTKEWPNARLYVYGSCANSFGFSKSDIDICLVIEDPDVKSEVLLKLAEILQSNNLQNVQALTRARVPIVKLMDPGTGISCDICVNNVLAVINTKLLRDYAQIDARLQQLAFIVKYWAKSRGVNETYRGTLSSYAYVLMCIHFLQLRRPAILPCLQGMDATYFVTVDNTECSYFDQVERLCGFGSHNGENISRLVWSFFNYWAYCHDYANDVISVRAGRILSKRVKDWTRRVGRDRHLICIEDPFEISHDLGRVVDKFSIGVLREEFERAAEIMQYDPQPCVKLFEPYVPS